MTIISKKIEIKAELLESISKIAKDENTTEKKILNQIIEEGIKNRTKNKLPEDLIINKETYNPDSKRSRELIGIIKTKEPFDTAKAIREIRGIE